MLTLELGIRAYTRAKVEVTVLWQVGTSANASHQLAARVHDALRAARRFSQHVIIYYGFLRSYDENRRLVQQLRAPNVRIVQYQTEPLEAATACKLARRNMDKCWVAGVAQGSHDVWDYSPGNLRNLRAAVGKRTRRTFRYVPLGALPDEAARPQAVHTAERPRLTFFGQTKWYPSRRALWSNITRALGERAQLVYYAFDDTQFARLITDGWAGPEKSRESVPPSSIFLNMHKHAPEYGAAPVTFRAAKLLDAGALIISVRCHPEDESEFHGLVDFVDEADVVPAFTRLADLSNVSRHALAARRRAMFRRRFTPRKIFEQGYTLGLTHSCVLGAPTPARQPDDFTQRPVFLLLRLSPAAALTPQVYSTLSMLYPDGFVLSILYRYYSRGSVAHVRVACGKTVKKYTYTHDTHTHSLMPTQPP